VPVPRFSRLRLAALAVCAATLVASCGGSDDSADESGLAEVAAAVDGLERSARVARLRELAEKEGNSLTLYTSMTPGDEDEISSAFEEAHGIEVSVYRASTEVIARRLAEEHSASFHGADVVETNSIVLTYLTDQGILAPYQPRTRAPLAPESSPETWTGDRFNVFVASWNTDRVSEAERPRSWEDLADPRWRGKLGLEAGDYDWYQGLYTYWQREGKAEAEIDRLFEAIARNAVVVKGHSLLAQLLASGEIDVAAANYRHIVQRFVDDDAPIAWEPPVEPLFTRAEGVGVLDGSRHPAAAILFTEWILEDGQKVIAELGRDTRSSIELNGARAIEIDVRELAENQDEWADRFERLIRLGRAGPSES
jgi:iron(III) transport system substrate-binding protein